MATTEAYQGYLTIGGVEIQKITSLSKNFPKDTADDTTYDSNGWEEKKIIKKRVSLDVSCKYEELTGQEDILDEAYSNETTLAVVYRPTGTGSGQKEWTFTALVTSLTVDGPHDDTLNMNFTLESTGSATMANQT